jgi:hypothetical protein
LDFLKSPHAASCGNLARHQRLRGISHVGNRQGVRRLDSGKLRLLYGPPEALGNVQKAAIEKWWPVVKAANIKAE